MVRAAALAAALLCGGCGTVTNVVWESPARTEIYGGVGRDVQVLRDFAADVSNPKDLEDGSRSVLGMVLLGAIDLPLSAIGDTLTLPVTVPVSLLASRRSAAPAASPAETTPVPAGTGTPSK